MGPSSDLDYFLTVIESRNEIIRPHVIVLSRDSVIETIMAARIEEVSIPYKIGYITIYNPTLRLLTIPHGGILGNQSQTNMEAIFNELMAFLKHGKADALYINSLREDSYFTKLANACPNMLCRGYFPKKSAHWTMNIPVVKGKLFAHMSSNHRYKLRRLPKTLNKAFPGQIAVKCFRYQSEVDQLCKHADEVASKTYQRSLGAGFDNDEEHRRRMTLYASKGRLLSYILYIQDKPVAFLIGSIYGTTVYLGFTGYDPAYRKYELGTILFVKLLEDLYLYPSPINTVDFGSGDALYKRMLCDNQNTWNDIDLYIFAPTWKAMIVNAIGTFIRGLSNVLQYIVQRLEIEQKVKTTWRRLISQKLRSVNNR